MPVTGIRVLIRASICLGGLDIHGHHTVALDTTLRDSYCCHRYSGSTTRKIWKTCGLPGRKPNVITPRGETSRYPLPLL